MKNYPDPQYLESIRKGSTVCYGDKPYRVQDDGRGWLHIVVKGRKVSIKDLGCWFEYGTKADWVFNEWWRVYPDYEMFEGVAKSERVWI